MPVRVADFHALRHTYTSRLVASGANIKVAREPARHEEPFRIGSHPPTLTLGRYSHVQVLDQTKALDAGPSIEGNDGERGAAAATRTEPASPGPY